MATIGKSPSPDERPRRAHFGRFRIWPNADCPLMATFDPFWALGALNAAGPTLLRAALPQHQPCAGIEYRSPIHLAHRPGVCQRLASPREQRLEVNMVNNRTPAQTRWGLGNPDDELENPNNSCPRCTGAGRDPSGQQCCDCMGTGTAPSQSPK